MFFFRSQRTQRVEVNGKQSGWSELARGVHQVTVLGPLLFNLFVNDLKDGMDSKSRLIQYADDCLIYSSGQDSHQTLAKLQKKMSEVSNNTLASINLI